MEAVFWVSLLAVAYAYFGYPFLLLLLGAVRRRGAGDIGRDAAFAPPLTVLIPAHNEVSVIADKIENTLALKYAGPLQIVIVSDGSTDGTADIVSGFTDDERLTFIDLPERKGKANALNTGVAVASGEIIVFSDASIMLEPDAVAEIVQPFLDDSVGCVSGEDLIEGGEGEGLYGRYELFLRNQESRVASIVGASGSFYAQRKPLVPTFPEGIAPDLLSVLHSVSAGSRAVSCPAARGYMGALSNSGDEFRRKVRTVIRGMTALFERPALLNPLRFPLFSLFLISHKIMRWLVPFFLLLMLVSSAALVPSPFYTLMLAGQLLFYLVAALALVSEAFLHRFALSRVPLFFTVANAAIFVAWLRYLRGFRQEIWSPSKRS